MLFNSGIFLFFFSGLYSLYLFLNHRQQNLLLLLGSYFFYSFWDWRFLVLILASTAIDYICAKKIEESDIAKIRKQWLFISLFINFSILGFFKYYNFFIETFQQLIRVFGFQLNDMGLSIILPLGISFYTFQTVSYTVDVYRGQQVASRNILNFALYVSFFPQLMAGPIERASKLLKQIENKREICEYKVRYGTWLILWGIFKKVYIADNMASYTSLGIGSHHLGLGSTIDFWLASIAFSLRFYCDFSGYSDIAIGLSSLLGIELSRNFNLPFFASNPVKLWRSWHITLSDWFRSYVFKPLSQRIHPLPSLIITMVLVGLWHGAHIKFLLWGLCWGIVLVVYHSINKFDESFFKKIIKNNRIRTIAGILLTCFLWIFINLFFVTENIQNALIIQESLIMKPFEFTSRSFRDFCTILFYSWPLILVEVIQYKSKKENSFFLDLVPNVFKFPFILLLIILLLSGGAVGEQEFIYFHF